MPDKRLQNGPSPANPRERRILIALQDYLAAHSRRPPVTSQRKRKRAHKTHPVAADSGRAGKGD